MKKKYLLTFVISIFSFFCFMWNGEAATTCTYEIENFAAQSGFDYNQFYGYILNRLDPISYQEKMITRSNDYFKYLTEYFEKNIPKLSAGWGQIMIVPSAFGGEYTEIIDGNSISGSIQFYRFTGEKFDSNKKKYVPKYKNDFYDVTNHFKYSSGDNFVVAKNCADILFLKIDIDTLNHSNAHTALIGVNRIYYSAVPKYFDGTLPDDLMTNNSKYVYLLALNENSDIYKYYNIKKYDLSKRMEDFKLVEDYDIEKIFRTYKSYGFDYVKVYNLLNKSGGKINEDIVKELSDEISKIPYFNNATKQLTSQEIANYIWHDVEILQNYAGNVLDKMIQDQNALYSAGSTIRSQDELFSIMEKYEEENYARYVKTTFEFLYELIKDDDSKIKSILDAQLDNDIKKIATDKCNDPQKSEEQQTQCKNEQCELLSFDCNKMQNEYYTPLNEMEHIIYYNSVSNCNDDRNDRNCIVEKCNIFQEKALKSCPKAVVGESEAQKNLEEIASDVFQNVLPKLGFDIKDDDLCTFLFDTDDPNVKPLYYYIVWLLNIIRIGGPILVIVLTALDGMKTISSFKDDEGKKFYGKLKIRLICLAILILVPSILKFAIDLFELKVCDIENLENSYYEVVKK